MSRKVDDRNSVFDPNFQERDIDAKILAGIERMSEILKIVLWEESSRNYLSITQVQILLSLLFEKRLNIKLLENILSLDKTTLSKSIKNLEKKGFIERKTGEKDKREKYIKISEKKLKTIKRISLWANAFKKILRNYTLEEKEIILKFIFDFIDYALSKGIISYQRMCSHCIYFKVKNERFFCEYLKKDLELKDLRLNCPDFLKV